MKRMMIGKRHHGRSRQLATCLWENILCYIQKFCFFLFNWVEKSVTPKEISETYRMLPESERALFEALIGRLTVTQIALLPAIEKEPTNKLFPAENMKRHRSKSTGGFSAA